MRTIGTAIVLVGLVAACSPVNAASIQEEASASPSLVHGPLVNTTCVDASLKPPRADIDEQCLARRVLSDPTD